LGSIHQIHDLQPYHCTYQDCSDPGRLYGSKQDWIDHEDQHRRVWHCHSHDAEFETQPDYQRHLETLHPEYKPEDYTPEIFAAVVGASKKPHRDCPFCPTAFNDVTGMRKHVRYHLERLALYALPDSRDDMNDELVPERSSDSNQVIENKGRKASIGNDFDEPFLVFLATFEESDEDPERPSEGGSPLSVANLSQHLSQSHAPDLDGQLLSQYLASS
jgi:hypothetical protein